MICSQPRAPRASRLMHDTNLSHSNLRGHGIGGGPGWSPQSHQSMWRSSRPRNAQEAGLHSSPAGHRLPTGHVALQVGRLAGHCNVAGVLGQAHRRPGRVWEGQQARLSGYMRHSSGPGLPTRGEGETEQCGLTPGGGRASPESALAPTHFLLPPHPLTPSAGWPQSLSVPRAH